MRDTIDNGCKLTRDARGLLMSIPAAFLASSTIAFTLCRHSSKPITCNANLCSTNVQVFVQSMNLSAQSDSNNCCFMVSVHLLSYENMQEVAKHKRSERRECLENSQVHP